MTTRLMKLIKEDPGLIASVSHCMHMLIFLKSFLLIRVLFHNQL